MENNDKIKRTLVGKVVSDKMNKTIAVVIMRTVKHLKYGKILKRRTKILVHDENQVSKLGDTVRIKQTRPISKQKSWVLDEVM